MVLRTTRKSQQRKSSAAVVFALGTLLVALIVISKREPPAAVVSVPTPIVVSSFDTVSVPVPLEFVPAGTRVKDIRVKQVEFPKQQVPSGTVTDLSSYAEAVTLTALPSNLPFFADNFSLTRTSANAVVERIPQGMRAMTIQVDATSAVEGWAGSGSVVDVLLVDRDRTTVVAEKVKILSAERSVTPVEGAPAPSVPRTVTILVTQEQCLAINTAIPRGRIALALRSLNDTDTWGTKTFRAEELRGGSSGSSSSRVSGYVSVTTNNKQEKKFAFVDGKWVPSETVPDGFRIMTKEIR